MFMCGVCVFDYRFCENLSDFFLILTSGLSDFVLYCVLCLMHIAHDVSRKIGNIK